jgi:glycosyltransferase involved in cell wall biosynthesis
MDDLRISIVTPSYNQGRFLEQCILSVIGQSYTNLEYLIMDGGSTDGSLDVIRRHEQSLAGWVSEADRGMYDAVEKGFRRCSGDIMGWINADDAYLPWTFRIVSSVFNTFPELQWITSRFSLVMNANGEVVFARTNEGYNREAFLRGRNLPARIGFSSSVVQQESTFWRRGLWETAGGRMDPGLQVAGDFELWARFFEITELSSVSVPLAAFRVHKGQRGAVYFEQYMTEAIEILRRHGRTIPGPTEILVRRALKQLPGSIQRRLPEGIAYTFPLIGVDFESDGLASWLRTGRRGI